MVASDRSFLTYREFDDALGLASAVDSELHDIRTGKSTQHGLAALLRQSVFSTLAGDNDTNDAAPLALDPAIRHVAGGRAVERSATSTSVMRRFETEILTQRRNRESLMDLPARWVDRVHEGKGLKGIVLDMNRSGGETRSHQEGCACSGYFECTCDQPLFRFNWHGSLERRRLRNGKS